jgi:hypothetical protein
MNAALFALITVALCPQEKVLLKHQPKAGDQMTVTEKMHAKIHMVVNAGGQKVELDVEQKESKRTVMDCLAVDGPVINNASYKVEEAVEEKKEPGAPDFTRSEKATHGKTIVVERKDGKVVHQGADDLSPKDLKDFDLDDTFAQSFPKQPVAVGESWEVPAETLKKMFHDPTSEGKMTLALKEVKEIDGRKCAVLDAALLMKGKTEEGVEISMDVKGPVVVWLERGYTQSAKLEGSMGLKANTPDAVMDGKGPMTVEITARFK